MYDAADQVTAFGSMTYRHDAVGNLVERAGEDQPRLACTYDGLGRLTGLQVGDDGIAYEYDGLGRRASRSDSSGRTRRIFDGVSVVAELSPTGDVALETMAGLLVLHRQDPSGEYYLHADGNGNAAVITGHGGAVLAQYEYTAFGTRVPLSSDPALPVRLGFCGALGVRE
ncbi:MAG TPA: hypothetical protein VHL53_09550, partial [Acidimicrobiia bacterium]|nr:hypothetical protein [Acidimicrobiia bacterium]